MDPVQLKRLGKSMGEKEKAIGAFEKDPDMRPLVEYIGLRRDNILETAPVRLALETARVYQEASHLTSDFKKRLRDVFTKFDTHAPCHGKAVMPELQTVHSTGTNAEMTDPATRRTI
jgi:hypothetical protein